jgi:hypothetical protein
MLVEQRTYTFHPGRLADFFELYEAEGRALHAQYLPHPLGHYVSESGMLNQVVSLWGYASHEQRSACRAALFADPRWMAYVDKVRPFMSAQESRILRPSPHFVEQLARTMGLEESP